MKLFHFLKSALLFLRDCLNTLFGEDAAQQTQRSADRLDGVFRAHQEEMAMRILAEARAKALEAELAEVRRRAFEEVNERSEITRTQIADYLECMSQIRTGSIFYREESLEIIGFCSQWVRNGLDAEWVRARSEQLEKERTTERVPPTLVKPEGEA